MVGSPDRLTASAWNTQWMGHLILNDQLVSADDHFRTNVKVENSRFSWSVKISDSQFYISISNRGYNFEMIFLESRVIFTINFFSIGPSVHYYEFHQDKSGHPKCLNPAPDLNLPVILHNDWEIEDKNSTKALNGFLKKYSMIF